MHERSVGAVFKQSPHQVSEQIAKLADRCIDTNADVGLIREQCVVQRIAHPVQPLKLITSLAGLGRKIRVRIQESMQLSMRCELRIAETPAPGG